MLLGRGRTSRGGYKRFSGGFQAVLGGFSNGSRDQIALPGGFSSGSRDQVALPFVLSGQGQGVPGTNSQFVANMILCVVMLPGRWYTFSRTGLSHFFSYCLKSHIFLFFFCFFS